MEELKKLLGDELYNQLVTKLGDKKLLVDDGNFIPKSRFDEVNNQKKDLKTQVDTLTATAAKFEAQAADVLKWKSEVEAIPAMKKKMEEWEASAKTATEELTKSKTQLETYQQKEVEWANQIKTTRIDSAIEKALIAQSAKYPELIKTKFDMSKIVLDEQGNVTGLEDQLKTVKESYKDLFGATVIVGPGHPDYKPGPGTEVDESKMSDAEFFAYKRSQEKK